MSDNLHTYYGFTLVDITPSQLTDDKHRSQQRNWETVSQLLTLRTQLLRFEAMGCITADVARYFFGINYIGMHRIWIFKFVVEYDEVYALKNDRYGKLKEDFYLTPIITDLDETVKPPLPLFYSSGQYKNIYFK